MRSYLPDYGVFTPKSLDEALEAFAEQPTMRPLAGGTDIMVYFEGGGLPPCDFLNLQKVQELRRPVEVNGSLHISALTTYNHIRRHQLASEQFPMLATAAREVGVLGIQSRGTWVGNVANASPAADGVPALMAYDAELEIKSKSGERKAELSRFYTGYKQMDLKPGELITGLRIPELPKNRKEYYRKVGTRRFQAITKTLLAAWMTLDGARVNDVRLVFASVAPYTLRARKTEEIIRTKELTPELINEAAKAIQDEINPIDDVRSNQNYRRTVTANLLKEFLGQNLPG